MSGPLSAGVMCTVSDVPPKLPFLRVVRGLRSYNITCISDALRRENGLREAFQGLKMRIPACLDPWGGRRGSKGAKQVAGASNGRP